MKAESGSVTHYYAQIFDLLFIVNISITIWYVG